MEAITPKPWVMAEASSSRGESQSGERVATGLVMLTERFYEGVGKIARWSEVVELLFFQKFSLQREKV